MQERYETFTVLINKIHRSIYKLKNREMSAAGLRSAHVSCLYYLYAEDSLTATELCERCEEDKATVSRALDRLEAEGYVSCKVKAEKRYKAPLYLTEQGRQAGKQIVDKVNEVLEALSTELTEAERLAFYRGLFLICNRLEQVAKSDCEQR